MMAEAIAEARDIPAAVEKAAAGSVKHVWSLAHMLANAEMVDKAAFTAFVDAGGIEAFARLAPVVPPAVFGLAACTRQPTLRERVVRCSAKALTTCLEGVKGIDAEKGVDAEFSAGEYVKVAVAKCQASGLFGGYAVESGAGIPNEAHETAEGVAVPAGPEEDTWEELNKMSEERRAKVSAAHQALQVLMNAMETDDYPGARPHGIGARRAAREICGPRLFAACIYHANKMPAQRSNALVVLTRLITIDGADPRAAELARAVVIVGQTPQLVHWMCSSVSGEASPQASRSVQASLLLAAHMSTYADVPIQAALDEANYLGGLRVAANGGALEAGPGELIYQLVVPVLEGLCVMLRDAVPDVRVGLLTSPVLAAVLADVGAGALEAGDEISTGLEALLGEIERVVKDESSPEGWASLAMLEAPLWLLVADHEFVRERVLALLSVLPNAARRCVAASPDLRMPAAGAPAPTRCCARCFAKEDPEGTRYNACAKCGILYCSRECQVADWKKPGVHKRVCSARVAAQAVAEDAAATS